MIVPSQSVMSDSLQPHKLQFFRLLCPGGFPSKNTGLGCHALLREIFPNQGSNQVFCIAGGFLTIWATKKALTPQLFMGQIYFWTNLLEMTIFRLRPKTRISETLGVGFSNLFKVFRVFLVFSKAWRIISNHFLKKKKKKGRKKEKKRKEGWLWAVTIMAKVTVLIRRNNFTWSIPSM